jgi:hypothetical protein
MTEIHLSAKEDNVADHILKDVYNKKQINTIERN